MSASSSVATTPPARIAVPDHGWTLHVAPSGHLYAFHHLRKHTSWKLPHVHPDPPLVPFPPPVPQYVISVPTQEKPVQKMRLGQTHHYVIWTDAGNRYFYNTISKRSTWRLTPDLYPLLDEAERLRTKMDTEGNLSNTLKEEDQKLLHQEEVEEGKAIKSEHSPGIPHTTEKTVVEGEDANLRSELEWLEAQCTEAQEGSVQGERNALKVAPSLGLVGYSTDEEEGDDDDDDEGKQTSLPVASTPIGLTGPSPVLDAHPAHENDHHGHDHDYDDDDEIGVPTLEHAVLRFYEDLAAMDVRLARWEDLEQRWPGWVYATLPDPHERKRLFDLFCAQHAPSLGPEASEEAEERIEAEQVDPEEAYKQLVLAHRALFWEEFKRKFQRDPRFLGYGQSHKEREALFQKFRKEAKSTSSKAKKERHVAALKERARQVQRERAILAQHTRRR